MQIISLLLSLFLILSQSKPKLTLGAGGFGYGCGSNSPAAQVPYSFVRLGPDTAPLIKKQYLSFQHFGGYSDADRYLRAFSHLHLVGAGVIDLGAFGILPTKLYKKDSPPNDQRVILFKDTQYAQPGYYKVDIQYNISVQLTTTQRVGAHRYSFHSKGPHQINVLTGSYLDQKTQRNSTTKICGQKCLEGIIHIMGGFGGRFGGYNLFYHLQWNSDGQDQLKLFNDSSVDKSSKEMKGVHSGCLIVSNSSKIEMFMGISYVSIQNAKLNYQNQAKGKNFDQLKQQSINIWAKQFSRFEISAITEDYQTKIDTALYRTMLTPTLFNDINREYPSFKNDGSISIVPNDMENVYTDMSIWDVHRTQMPWLLLQDPKRFRDIAKSLVLMNRDGGYMPKWPFAQGWTGCMIGSHANTILADWIIKQAKKDKKQNITEVFSYMLRNANTHTPHDSRPEVDFYRNNGYIPFENNQRSACAETLELSFNDYSISQIAQLLNQSQHAKDFKNRSLFYKNVWNNQTKFFQPKYKNGTFYPLGKNERLNVFSNHYVEGNAWHYRFAVPHGGQQLINLFGGNQAFVKQLSKFFEKSKYWPTLWLPNPYYWAGNEHDLFSVWLFSFAGRYDLTSKYSRMIMRSSYGIQGNGLPGNDDYATMSAWFIFAGLGFYPLPSTQTYILGSPIVHSARIYRRMIDGSLSPINIRANKNSEKQWKVQSVNLNQNIVDRFISHQQLIKSNSMLTFSMKL